MNYVLPLFSRWSARVVALAACVLMFAHTANAQMLYTEGKDYTVLDQPLPLAQQGTPEVLEFFSYACPHCANLEPHIVTWAQERKPEAVLFRQMPVVGGRMWTFTAQAKFTANKLKLGRAFDEAYFQQVHEKQNRRLLGDKDSVINLMVTYGADKEKAEKAWKSLQVKNNMKTSVELFKLAQLRGVPGVVVNGKYVVVLTEYERFFNVIDFLLATTTPDE